MPQKLHNRRVLTHPSEDLEEVLNLGYIVASLAAWRAGRPYPAREVQDVTALAKPLFFLAVWKFRLAKPTTGEQHSRPKHVVGSVLKRLPALAVPTSRFTQLQARAKVWLSGSLFGPGRGISWEMPRYRGVRCDGYKVASVSLSAWENDENVRKEGIAGAGEERCVNVANT
jgi:hypothetical protein